ncbi:hypothetical protein CI610_02596 [invertebrate metagenome]|uniref:Uncharacterized protein n=1 Tax=invertebrate metagenome TaxID=1711999 RepID=A0A2H9T5J5_9ZZZZ
MAAGKATVGGVIFVGALVWKGCKGGYKGTVIFWDKVAHPVHVVIRKAKDADFKSYTDDQKAALVNAMDKSKDKAVNMREKIDQFNEVLKSRETCKDAKKELEKKLVLDENESSQLDQLKQQMVDEKENLEKLHKEITKDVVTQAKAWAEETKKERATLKMDLEECQKAISAPGITFPFFHIGITSKSNREAYTNIKRYLTQAQTSNKTVEEFTKGNLLEKLLEEEFISMEAMNEFEEKFKKLKAEREALLKTAEETDLENDVVEVVTDNIEKKDLERITEEEIQESVDEAAQSYTEERQDQEVHSDVRGENKTESASIFRKRSKAESDVKLTKASTWPSNKDEPRTEL